MNLFSRKNAKSWETENVRAVTGLLVVVAGIFAVVALAVTAVALLGGSNKSSVVAITTAALGIISAVVSGYLGIKATANTSAKAGEKVEEAAHAQTRAEIAQEGHDALMAAVEAELPEDQANAVKAAALSQRPKPDRPNPPAKGG